jgi:hypothetical protein
VNSEVSAGFYLAVGLAIVGGFVMLYISTRASRGGLWDRSRAWTAAFMAYGFYLAADLLANAEFPKFLRDHFFDGFAPAAVVGLLVDRFFRRLPSEKPTTNRPIWSVLGFSLSAALTFGAIGAIAVFTSGSNGYFRAVLATTVFGACAFAITYVTSVRVGTGWKWWFQRPKGGRSL